MNRRNGKSAPAPTRIRCAIYTRKSTEEGLEQEFNSLDAQRDAGEAYVISQRQEGWICLPDRYDDGGFTGANMDRPALRRLLADIAAGKIDLVIVYKVDRLSRSLLDFAKMMEIFEQHGVAFVSVTQLFNTATSMGRLILNVLLSFAQFERELISERTRDKIAATRRRGKWNGGHPLLGYDVDPLTCKLQVNADEAQRVRRIFALYLEHRSLRRVLEEVERLSWRTKSWRTRKGNQRGGKPLTKSTLHYLLSNVAYCGKVRHKKEAFPGEHEAIIDPTTWDQVQNLLAQEGNGRGLEYQTSAALLKGLLFCRPCGTAMVPTHAWARGKKYRYYVCSNKQKRGSQACPCPSLPAHEIETFVLDQVRTTSLGSAVLSEIGSEPGCMLRQVLERIECDGKRFTLAFVPGNRHEEKQDEEATSR